MGPTHVGRALGKRAEGGAVIYHVPRHCPLQTLGNDEADNLARIRSLILPRGDQAVWLHKQTGHAGP